MSEPASVLVLAPGFVCVTPPIECRGCHVMRCFFKQTPAGWRCWDCTGDA